MNFSRSRNIRWRWGWMWEYVPGTTNRQGISIYRSISSPLALPLPALAPAVAPGLLSLNIWCWRSLRTVNDCRRRVYCSKNVCRGVGNGAMTMWAGLVKAKLTAQHFEVDVEVNHSLQNSNLCLARRRSENPFWNDQGHYIGRLGLVSLLGPLYSILTYPKHPTFRKSQISKKCNTIDNRSPP